MRILRLVAFVVAFLGLGLGGLLLVAPVNMSFTTGVDSHAWSCGSPAFPNDLSDFGAERIEDATNCAGHTPAAGALGAFVLAGAALVVIAFTTWRLERAGADDPPGVAPA